ncbi:MAG: condensation domain-containing protein, partial [Acidobacteriota bacterium]
MRNETIEGYRLSPQQERLWFLQQPGAGGGLPQRAACAILIEGELLPEVLRGALSRVVDRHEILRTNFELFPAMTVPVQVIADHGALEMQESDASELTADVQEAGIDSQMEEMLQQRPGDAAPLNVSLVKLSTRKHLLALSLPALCVDRTGIANLIREIADAYGACCGVEAETSAEALQYADVAEILNELLESEDTQAGRDYWRDEDFSAFRLARLPYEPQTPDERTLELRSVSLRIAGETLAQVEELARKYQTTTAALLLACWQTLLWRLSGQAEIIVGTTYDCRTYAGLDKSIGLFAKHLPIRSQFKASTSFSTILRHVDKQMAERAKWQEYFTWEHLAQNDAGHDGIGFFPFAFELAEAHPEYTCAGASFSIYKEQVTVERFKVKLCCSRSNGVLIAELYYDSHLFGAEAIERLAGQYQSLLQSALSNPEVQISKLELLGEAERQQLLFEWNQTTAATPASCLHQLFEAQVECAPDAVAVIFEEQQLSYG